MSSAVILIAFVGFAPTYYLKGFFETPSLSLLHHLHGLTATIFVLSFLGQAILVFANRTRLHRLAGRFVATAAVLTAVSMGVLSLRAVAARNEIEGAMGSFHSLSVRLFLSDVVTLAMFSLFLGLGLASTSRPELHKRFMLLVLLSLMPPTIGRIASFGRETPDPVVMLPIFLPLLAAPIVYDIFARGRPHPVFAVGSPALFLGAFLAAFVLPRIELVRELVLRL